jgi:hypothetical protein
MIPPLKIMDFPFSPDGSDGYNFIQNLDGYAGSFSVFFHFKRYFTTKSPLPSWEGTKGRGLLGRSDY